MFFHRVCQHEKEEALIELGCQCRGGLAKAHRSCIDAWFRTRGSNKCEICQQMAANVEQPESHPSTNYWFLRVDPGIRRSAFPHEREMGCFSPLWVAFCILIGGLLLDVLISITLGVSALPVNIIIGMYFQCSVFFFFFFCSVFVFFFPLYFKHVGISHLIELNMSTYVEPWYM